MDILIYHKLVWKQFKNLQFTQTYKITKVKNNLLTNQIIFVSLLCIGFLNDFKIFLKAL